MDILASISYHWKRKKRRATTLLIERYYRQRIKWLPMSLNRSERPRPLVISLSTIPWRLFRKTDVAIATLLNQKLRADRIILWLSDELKEVSLPKSFAPLIRAGVEVQYRPDVGPHTKLIYALQECPDSLIVSADDDMLYPSTWLSDLYASYQLAPHHIHCHNADLIRKDEKGRLLPYLQWNLLSPGILGPSHSLYPLGFSGILYPPGSLDPEVFNLEALRRLSPLNDDIWFKAMALLQGTICQKVKPYGPRPRLIDGSQQVSLYARTYLQYDPQLRATFDAYDLCRLL